MLACLLNGEPKTDKQLNPASCAVQLAGFNIFEKSE